VRGRPEGAALILAVLLSLAAILLAHGALVIAREELVAARSAGRVLGLEHLAALGVREGAEAMALVRDSAPAEVSGVAGEATWRGRVRRLSDEIWLAEGEAFEREAVRRLALPLWRLDPATRVRAFGAVVTTGGTSAVSGGERIAPPPPPASGSLGPPEPCSPTVATTPLGGWLVDPDSGAADLGRLDVAGLVARASSTVVGIGTPEPQEVAGFCLAAPWNWGDPGAPDAACGLLTPLVVAEPGVTVRGGTGQGVIVARGDLTLVGTTFYGILLVEGVLRLEGEAVVTGLVRARSGAAFGPGSRVEGSPCWAASVLSMPELRRAAPIVHGGWLRPFG
jgi:hypothetical protein